MTTALLGHNANGISIRIEVRLFNSLARFAPEGERCISLSLPAGREVAHIVTELGIPVRELFLVFVNGRDVTPGLYDAVRLDRALEDGDVVAFSGPVPYSWGYGSPVV